jgi:hypothetical protein
VPGITDLLAFATALLPAEVERSSRSGSANGIPTLRGEPGRVSADYASVDRRSCGVRVRRIHPVLAAQPCPSASSRYLRSWRGRCAWRDAVDAVAMDRPTRGLRLCEVRRTDAPLIVLGPRRTAYRVVAMASRCTTVDVLPSRKWDDKMRLPS